MGRLIARLDAADVFAVVVADTETWRSSRAMDIAM
jgi:hypothetical protein